MSYKYTNEELEQKCKNCFKPLLKHRAYDDACPVNDFFENPVSGMFSKEYYFEKEDD